MAEYTNTDNSVRKVDGLKTNSWCSAGAALLGGLIYNLGGGGDNPGPNGTCCLSDFTIPRVPILLKHESLCNFAPGSVLKGPAAMLNLSQDTNCLRRLIRALLIAVCVLQGAGILSGAISLVMTALVTLSR